MQKGEPLVYASRAMTSAEQNCAQIEKGDVGNIFATSMFHNYVHGKPKVSVQTYHIYVVAITIATALQS